MSSNQSDMPNTYNDGDAPRVQLGIGDWIKMMLKEIWLMLAVFSIIAAVGIAFAMTMQKKYTAEARLSVLVGEEYVSMLNSGGSGGEASPKQEQVIQSEIEVMTSAPVASRTVEAIGLDKLFSPKDLVVANGQSNEQARFNAAVEQVRKDFGASSTPNTTVIRLSMSNKNPEMAAKALNELINEYLIYRRMVLFENRTPGFEEQTDEFSKELASVNNQISEFLKTNNISDFDAENTNLQNLLATTRQSLYDATSKLSEAEGRYSSTSTAYSRLPSEIRLSFETDNSKRKMELQQQLSELRTKYTEQSRPVREMKQRIAAVDSVLNSDAGMNSGTVRTGPNPVKDSIATDRARNMAEVAAAKDRQEVLVAQVKQLQDRAMKLSSLRPQYEDLMRRKGVLDDQVKQFATRAANAKAQNQMAHKSNDNIRIIERASVPTKGKSMKKIAILGSILFAAFTALIAGILHALLSNNYPTPKSVGRTLGLPVLATVTR